MFSTKDIYTVFDTPFDIKVEINRDTIENFASFYDVDYTRKYVTNDSQQIETYTNKAKFEIDDKNNAVIFKMAEDNDLMNNISMSMSEFVNKLKELTIAGAMNNCGVQFIDEIIDKQLDEYFLMLLDEGVIEVDREYKGKGILFSGDTMVDIIKDIEIFRDERFTITTFFEEKLDINKYENLTLYFVPNDADVCFKITFTDKDTSSYSEGYVMPAKYELTKEHKKEIHEMPALVENNTEELEMFLNNTRKVNTGINVNDFEDLF